MRTACITRVVSIGFMAVFAAAAFGGHRGGVAAAHGLGRAGVHLVDEAGLDALKSPRP